MGVLFAAVGQPDVVEIFKQKFPSGKAVCNESAVVTVLYLIFVHFEKNILEMWRRKKSKCLF